MNEKKLKIGQAIIVCGSHPCVGTSTAAALIASTLAKVGDKTLLFSTDYTHPFDAASILSDVVTENHMDELVALENSSGLNAGNVEDYTSLVSNSLAYTRLSTMLNSISRHPARTLSNILDAACRVFRYVVLDLDYQSAGYLPKLSEHADIVTFLFGQDFQSLQTAKTLAKAEDTGAVMLPVLMNGLGGGSVIEAALAKTLGTNTVITVEHDPEIFKAAQKRDIAGFVFRNGNNTGGLKGIFKKRNIQENSTLQSVTAVCDLLKNVSKTETEALES